MIWGLVGAVIAYGISGMPAAGLGFLLGAVAEVSAFELERRADRRRRLAARARDVANLDAEVVEPVLGDPQLR